MDILIRKNDGTEETDLTLKPKELFKKIKNNKKNKNSFFEVYDSKRNFIKLFFCLKINIIDEEDIVTFIEQNIKKKVNDLVALIIKDNYTFLVNDKDTVSLSKLYNNVLYTYYCIDEELYVNLIYSNILVNPGFIKHKIRNYIKNKKSFSVEKLDILEYLQINNYDNLELPLPFSPITPESELIYSFNVDKKISFDNYKNHLFTYYDEEDSDNFIFLNDGSAFNFDDKFVEENSFDKNLINMCIFTLENTFCNFLDKESIIKSKDESSNRIWIKFKILDCKTCNRKHKNYFYLNVGMSNNSKAAYWSTDVHVGKFGNINSCIKLNEITSDGKLKSIKKKLDKDNSNYLFILYDYIFRDQQDNTYIWDYKQLSWKCVNLKSPISDINYIENLDEVFHNLLNKDDLIKLKNRIHTSLLKFQCIEIDQDPYVICFTNGVYDLRINEFIEGQESRHYHCTLTTGYKWEDVENSYGMEKEKYMKIKFELYDIINKIQPIDEFNAKNRIEFEQVLSSGLLGKNKEKIYFFLGDTKAGKTSIMNLTANSLGEYFLKSDNTLLNFNENTSTPSPMISKINNKRLISVSEFLGKLTGNRIKKLTEDKIYGRALYSNKVDHKNTSVIIIDTNDVPKIDFDNATIRRVGCIKFYSYFLEPKNIKQLVFDNNIKYKFTADIHLNSKISSKRYSLAFFNLLLEWYNKYHFDGLNLNDNNIDHFLIGKLLKLFKKLFILNENVDLDNLERDKYLIKDNKAWLCYNKLLKYFKKKIFELEAIPWDDYTKKNFEILHANCQYSKFILREDLKQSSKPESKTKKLSESESSSDSEDSKQKSKENYEEDLKSDSEESSKSDSEED